MEPTHGATPDPSALSTVSVNSFITYDPRTAPKLDLVLQIAHNHSASSAAEQITQALSWADRQWYQKLGYGLSASLVWGALVPLLLMTICFFFYLCNSSIVGGFFSWLKNFAFGKLPKVNHSIDQALDNLGPDPPRRVLHAGQWLLTVITSTRELSTHILGDVHFDCVPMLMGIWACLAVLCLFICIIKYMWKSFQSVGGSSSKDMEPRAEVDDLARIDGDDDPVTHGQLRDCVQSSMKAFWEIQRQEQSTTVPARVDDPGKHMEAPNPENSEASREAANMNAVLHKRDITAEQEID